MDDDLIKMELNLKDYENFFILLDKKAIWPLEDIEIDSDKIEHPSILVSLDFKNKNNMSQILINGYINGRFYHELIHCAVRPRPEGRGYKAYLN